MISLKIPFHFIVIFETGEYLPRKCKSTNLGQLSTLWLYRFQDRNQPVVDWPHLFVIWQKYEDKEYNNIADKRIIIDHNILQS